MASNFSVELFKVPFDNSYKKVFDINKQTLFYSTDCEKTFHDKVLLTYTNKNIAQPSVSNIKRYNNRIIFTIRESYFNCRNYNYVSLNYEDKYYFYFITDIISENDNPANPAITITAEWDVWHNHLSDFYKNEIINKNKFIRSHKDRFNENKEPIFYRNNISKRFTKKLVKYTDEIGGYNDIYSILWVKITVTDEFFTYASTNLSGKINITTNENANTKGIKPFTNSNFKNTIYIPYSVYKKGNNISATITSKYTVDAEKMRVEVAAGGDIASIWGTDCQTITLPYITKSGEPLTFDENLTPYFKSIEFTFNSPYKYSIVENTTNKVEVNIFAPYIVIDNFFNYKQMAVIGAPQQVIYSGEYKDIGNYLGGADIYSGLFTPYFNYEITKEINLNSMYSITPVTDINENDEIDYEPKLFIYPFRYISLYYNNNEIVLDLPENLSQTRNYKIKLYNKTSQPYIKVYYNNLLIYSGNIYLNNSGEITNSIDASVDYSIRNGAQQKLAIGMATMNDIFHNLINFSSGNILKTQYSGILKSAEIESKYIDLNKTPDTVVLSSRGEDDIEIQDRIIVYTNTSSDDLFMIEKYKEFYIYGYEYSEIKNVTENSRFWFDYKQTQNCKLNNFINANDKQRIEQMFDEGVHMFHINYDINTEQIIVNRSMEFNGKNNIERSIATI